ncbi:MAG: hypothetical protein ACN2B6_11645 [Rickettsiales bacterium]
MTNEQILITIITSCVFVIGFVEAFILKSQFNDSMGSLCTFIATIFASAIVYGLGCVVLGV